MLRIVGNVFGEWRWGWGEIGGLELEWDRNGANPADNAFSNVNSADN